MKKYVWIVVCIALLVTTLASAKGNEMQLGDLLDQKDSLTPFQREQLRIELNKLQANNNIISGWVGSNGGIDASGAKMGEVNALNLWGYRIYMTGGQSTNDVVTATDTPLTFASYVTLQQSGEFWKSSAPTQFIIPADGWYRITYVGQWETAFNADGEMWLNINSVARYRPLQTINPSDDGIYHNPTPFTRYFSRGDVLIFYARQSSGSNSEFQYPAINIEQVW